MGTYLALGLPTKIKASAAELKKINLSVAQAAKRIAQEAVAVNNAAVWDVNETETTITWSIRPEMLYAHAADLLQNVGDFYYPEGRRKEEEKAYDYNEAVSAIRKCNDGDAILTLSNGRYYTHFQNDRYHADWIDAGSFGNDFKIQYEITMFFMEGKVRAEGIGRYPNLIQNLFAKALPENPLAQMLLLYITD